MIAPSSFDIKRFMMGLGPCGHINSATAKSEAREAPLFVDEECTVHDEKLFLMSCAITVFDMMLMAEQLI